MIKVVKAKYLSACDSCGSKCTHLIHAGRKYLHVCTTCLLETFKQCESALAEDYKESKRKWEHESQEQVEQ